MIRQPAVAGTFYPKEPDALRRQVEDLAAGAAPPPAGAGGAAVAILVPHAGYVYSGRIAAVTYRAVSLPRSVVVLCPNHTGRGAPIAMLDEGGWQTPLGDAPIDGGLARAVLALCRGAQVDAEAHRREHAIEVQVPFLQVLAPDSTLVPICVGTLDLPRLLDLGRALAEAIGAAGGESLIVISSDLSHYIPAARAERQDRKAIDRVLAVDPEGLHRVVLEEEISMCGVAPAVAGLEAARRLGAGAGRLIAYGHSGEINGDTRSVVGYAGIVLPR